MGRTMPVRRAVRLLMMIGFAVVAYVALTAFDQAAHADEGLTDRLKNATVENQGAERAGRPSTASARSRVAIAPRPSKAQRSASIPRASAPRASARPETAPPVPTGQKPARHRPAPPAPTRPPAVSKSSARPAPGPQATTRPTSARPTSARPTSARPTSARPTFTPAIPALLRAEGLISRATGETAAGRTAGTPGLPEHLNQARVITAPLSRAGMGTAVPAEASARWSAGSLEDLAGRALTVVPGLSGPTATLTDRALRPLPQTSPSWSNPLLHALPAAEVMPRWPGAGKDIAGLPQILSMRSTTAVEAPLALVTRPQTLPTAAKEAPSAPAARQATPPQILSTAATEVPAARQAIMLPTGGGLPGTRVACDPAMRHGGDTASPAPAAPAPESPPRPDEHSVASGHARDSGGAGPLMATLSSSWWPEQAAASVLPLASASAPTRTARYCGPPS